MFTIVSWLQNFCMVIINGTFIRSSPLFMQKCAEIKDIIGMFRQYLSIWFTKLLYIIWPFAKTYLQNFCMVLLMSLLLAIKPFIYVKCAEIKDIPR